MAPYINKKKGPRINRKNPILQLVTPDYIVIKGLPRKFYTIRQIQYIKLHEQR